jgi:hypothetical protein
VIFTIVILFGFDSHPAFAIGNGTVGQTCTPGSCAQGLYCNSSCVCATGSGPDSCGTGGTGGGNTNGGLIPSSVSQGPCKDIDVKDPEALGKCIVAIYKWSLGASVILALLMIIFAGYLYITAGGNAQQVSTAKEFFAGAIIGLIILFAAVIILRTINPELVNFDKIQQFKLN